MQTPATTSSSRLGSGSGGRCVAIQVAKFEGFTAKAIEAIMVGREECRRIGDCEIDGHHILYGLISECRFAAKAFNSIGIKMKHIREQVHVLRERGVDRLGFEFSASATKDLILSFEEARRLGHNYIGPGHLLIGMLRRPQGYAADVLREYLGVDFRKVYTQVIPMVAEDIECAGLGAPTIGEYREHIRKDPPLAEPSVEETILILRDLKENYEIENVSTLVTAISLSDRYVSDRVLPEKAIDLMDKAKARVSARHAELLEIVRELKREFRLIIKSKKEAECSLDLDKLKELHNREMELRFQIYTFSKMSEANEIVEGVDIQGIVSLWTGIPVEKLFIDESDTALKMEETLHKRVIGQDEAVKQVCIFIQYDLWRVPRDTPIDWFVFFGPAGVGKSELAKALAANLFGSEEAVIQLDMREFMDCHAASKLIGSSPDPEAEGVKLTEAVWRRPRTVVLFKDIDKAHRDVLRMIYHIRRSGKLADDKGRIVDFRHTVLIMTCNAGSDVIGTDGQYGACHNEDCSYDNLGKKKLEQLFKGMRMPSVVIAFRQLTKPEVKQIADIKLKGLSDRLKAKEIQIRVAERFRERVVEKGYNFRDGAWPLCIAVTNLEDMIAEKMVARKINKGDSVSVDVDSDGNVLVDRNM
ncbi:hypothetical protein V6N13_145497 [Hibiscus sabdariffa]|uniref:Clp R domain-containing protein n=1 Tax=Hibiscus sabdariffa TaxID=183260 RepID=A0ABR2TQM5_9ROSI